MMAVITDTKVVLFIMIRRVRLPLYLNTLSYSHRIKCSCYKSHGNSSVNKNISDYTSLTLLPYYTTKWCWDIRMLFCSTLLPFVHLTSTRSADRADQLLHVAEYLIDDLQKWYFVSFCCSNYHTAPLFVKPYSIIIYSIIIWIFNFIFIHNYPREVSIDRIKMYSWQRKNQSTNLYCII